MSTMVTELAVPLRGSKLRAASRREVRAAPTQEAQVCQTQSPLIRRYRVRSLSALILVTKKEYIFEHYN